MSVNSNNFGNARKAAAFAVMLLALVLWIALPGAFGVLIVGGIIISGLYKLIWHINYQSKHPDVSKRIIRVETKRHGQGYLKQTTYESSGNSAEDKKIEEYLRIRSRFREGVGAMIAVVLISLFFYLMSQLKR